jgi:hypothetical protein
MNKIDLIIECMDEILNDELPSPEKMMKAFHYACELRELKPLAYYNKKHDTVITAYELGNHVDGNDVPLYPLEASNENASLP